MLLIATATAETGEVYWLNIVYPVRYVAGWTDDIVFVLTCPCPPLTGHCMVVREGLTNPWIPDNWSWGGVASDHCPVVAELYADVSCKEPNRPGVAVVDRGDVTPKHER